MSILGGLQYRYYSVSKKFGGFCNLVFWIAIPSKYNQYSRSYAYIFYVSFDFMQTKLECGVVLYVECITKQYNIYIIPTYFIRAKYRQTMRVHI